MFAAAAALALLTLNVLLLFALAGLLRRVENAIDRQTDALRAEEADEADEENEADWWKNGGDSCCGG